MAKKVKEQPQVEEQIVLDKELNKAVNLIEKYKKEIGIGLLAIIVLVVAGYLYKNYSEKKEINAQTAIAAAQTAIAQQQWEQALNGDGATAGLLKVMDEYSGTKTANLAKLYAAICYANTDKIDEAIKMYEDFNQKKDQMISPASLAALGNCYITKGQNDKGVELLLKAAKSADNDAVSPVFLLQAAQVYESMNKNEDAVKLYNQIKKDYFRSPIAQDIDKYIERATK